jgi:hypothetical protein
LVDQDARLALIGGTAPLPRIVWEDGHGQFRKAAWPGGELFPIPEGAVRLYLLAAKGAGTGLPKFLDGLGENFAFSPRPPFLSAGAANAAKDEALVRVCQYSFAPAPRLEGNPPR